MKKLLGLLAFVLLAVCAAAAFAWYDYRNTMSAPVLSAADNGSASASTTFVVERGWSASRTANELAARGLIEKPHWFYLHARMQPHLAGESRSIKSGEYIIRNNLTVENLFDLLVDGRAVQYSHSIIEGTAFKQLLASLADVDSLQQTDATASAESVMEALDQPGVHPEGLFFADTYNFPRNTTDIDFLRRSHELLTQVLDEEWQGRAEGLPYESAYEALVMASIIEKESAVSEERPLIAGVFVSRLRKGMRLQTDPTVIYGMGDSYDGNIRRRDLRTDTPYNTYTRAGLPPTPIAMVGREAINAALHPENTSKLFFVSKGDGTHHFSETVEEHNAAVRKYQLKR